MAAAGVTHLWHSMLAWACRTRLTPFGPPLSVAIGLTSRCTYRCMHCQVWREQHDEFGPEKWREVFDELAVWMGPTHVGLAGGEPFLRSDLGDIVQIAADCGLLPSVVTNGAPDIDPADVVAWPLVSLTLSLDSLDSGPHDALHRAPGAHRRVMDLAKDLCAAGMGRRLRIAAVLTSLNVDQIAPLAQWTAAQGIGGFTVQPLGEPFGSARDSSWYRALGLGVEPARVRAVVEQLRAGSRSGWPVLNPWRQLALLPRYYEDPERQIVPCTVGVASLGISPSGDLRFCPYLPPFGHVNDGPIRRQWFGDEAARGRALVRACTRGCSIMNCTFSPTPGERLRRWRRYVPALIHS